MRLPYDTLLSLIRQQTTVAYLESRGTVRFLEDEMDRAERQLRRAVRRGVVSPFQLDRELSR